MSTFTNPVRAGDPLTPREVEVLRWVACGFSNSQIAKHLFLSMDTVKTHLARTAHKLTAANRAHSVALAIRADLL